MLKLRGHHLICLHFFRGEGYSQEFVANLREVVARAQAGEEVELVAGADDVCRACPALEGDKCQAKPGVDAAIRKMDAAAAAHLGVKVGERVRWAAVKEKVAATPPGWFAAFCAGCDWEQVCAPRKKELGLL
ncbi:DUF1284 domain-containing protein [Thermodesulfitimonas autotrophica]|uniref:DUF1284 domain-containing protein n=1 Tax=Thermodesulfitimonas autotrophica TaxID=1894989 RepID=UPI002FDF379F